MLTPRDRTALLVDFLHREVGHEAVWGGAVPFIVATSFIAALPVLSYLLFHRRAVQAMPKVRDWMNTHSWLVNIIVYVVFILLILA